MHLFVASFVAAVLVVLSVAPAHSGTPTPLGCRRALAKVANKYGAAYVKTSSKCWLQVLAGKITGPCPDSKAFDKLGKSDVSTRAALTKACSGLTVADAGFPANCPGIDNNYGDPLASIDDVITCVMNVQARAAYSWTDSTFTKLSGGDSSALKCRTAVGKTHAKLYGTLSKILAKCEDDVLKEKIMGPCPDFSLFFKIIDVGIKADAAVCKACGGADKTCDGVDDVTAADIGITACENFSGCGAPVSTLEDMNNCLRCVTGSRTLCADTVTAQPNDVPEHCDPAS